MCDNDIVLFVFAGEREHGIMTHDPGGKQKAQSHCVTERMIEAGVARSPGVRRRSEPIHRNGPSPSAHARRAAARQSRTTQAYLWFLALTKTPVPQRAIHAARPAEPYYAGAPLQAHLWFLALMQTPARSAQSTPRGRSSAGDNPPDPKWAPGWEGEIGKR